MISDKNWERLENPEIQSTLLEEISGAGGMSIPAQNPVFASQPLSFYPGYKLYKLTWSETYLERRAYFLSNLDNDLRCLNFRSPVIHQTNTDLELSLNDESAATNYLRFFCRFVNAKDGPFYIAESADEFSWSSQIDDELSSHFSPLTVTSRPPNSGDITKIWRFDCSLLHDNKLFKVSMAVDQHGSVTMESDELVADNLPLRHFLWREDGNLTWEINYPENDVLSGIKEVDVSGIHQSAQGWIAMEDIEDNQQAVTYIKAACQNFYAKTKVSISRFESSLNTQHVVPQGTRQDAGFDAAWQHQAFHRKDKIGRNGFAVRIKPLDFYPMYDLFEFSHPDCNDSHYRSYMLYSDKTGETLFLDFKDTEIYQLNKIHLRLKGRNDVETTSNLEQFFHFHSFFCTAKGDPSYLINSKKDLKCHWLPDIKEKDSPKNIGKKITRLSVDLKPKPEEDNRARTIYHLSCSLLHWNNLYKSEFIISARGDVRQKNSSHLEGCLPVSLSEIDCPPTHEKLGVSWLRRCEPISVEDFVTLLRAGHTVADKVVVAQASGPVSLCTGDSKTLPKSTADENDRASGSDSQDGSYLEPITIVRSTIYGGLNFENTEFRASILFRNSRITLAQPPGIMADNEAISTKNTDTLNRQSGEAFSDSTAQSTKDANAKELQAMGMVLAFPHTRLDGSLILKQCQLEGSIDGRGAQVGGALKIKSTTLTKNINLSGIRCSQITLSGIDVGKLLMERMQTDGPLKLHASRVRKFTNLSESRLFSLSVNHLSSAGAFKGKQVQVSGAVNITASRFESWIDLSSLRAISAYFYDTKIKEGLFAIEASIDSDFTIRRSHIKSDVFLDYANIRGSIRADCEVIDLEKIPKEKWLQETKRLITRIDGDFDLHMSRIEGILALGGMRIDGSLGCSFIEAKAIFCRPRNANSLPAEIKKHVELGGALIRSHVEFEAINIGGAIHGNSVEMGSFYLDAVPAMETIPETESERILTPSSIGIGIRFINSEIRGNCRFRGIQVGLENGIDVEKYAKEHKLKLDPWMRHETGSLSLKDCKIGGAVQAHGLCVNPDLHLLARPKGLCMSDIQGSFCLDESEIEGTVDLRDVKVGGRLSLKRAKVKGDLRCHATPYQTEHHLTFCLMPGDTLRGDKTSPWNTYCSAFDIERLECHGDADLAGLIISKNEESNCSLNARKCIIDGRLRLDAQESSKEEELLTIEKLKNKQARTLWAIIPASLNLTAAKIDRLIISGNSFTQEGNPEEVGIVLQRATVHRLQILGPPLSPPMSVDIRSMTVTWWDVGGNKAREAIFKALLIADRYKERSTFHSIEASLLAEGHSETAVKIRKWMWNSERDGKMASGRNPQDKHQNSGSWLKYFLLEQFGYGRAWSIIGLFFASWLIMTLLLLSPNNVCPSLISLDAFSNGKQISQTMNRPCPVGMPDRQLWSFGDATWLSLRYHTPMLSGFARESWRASPKNFTSVKLKLGWRYNKSTNILTLEEPIFVWSAPTDDWTFSMEDYVSIVSALAWLLWALLILSVTGIVRRVGLQT